MKFQVIAILNSLTTKIKEAKRYQQSAYFIAIAILAIPITMNLLLLIDVFFPDAEFKKEILGIANFLSPLTIILLLIYLLNKKEVETVTLTNNQIKQSILYFLLYFIVSILLFVLINS